MPDGSHRFFDEQTAEVFRAIAGCVIPGDETGPGADADRAVALADRAIAARPESDQKLLATFLRAVDVLPYLRWLRPFRRLDATRRARVLRFLERNRLVPKLRVGFFGVKTYALLGFYGSESTFAELDYPGPRMDAPFYSGTGEDGAGETVP